MVLLSHSSLLPILSLGEQAARPHRLIYNQLAGVLHPIKACLALILWMPIPTQIQPTAAMLYTIQAATSDDLKAPSRISTRPSHDTCRINSRAIICNTCPPLPTGATFQWACSNSTTSTSQKRPLLHSCLFTTTNKLCHHHRIITKLHCKRRPGGSCVFVNLYCFSFLQVFPMLFVPPASDRIDGSDRIGMGSFVYDMITREVSGLAGAGEVG